MSLMERVATLLRANVNDLIDNAEDPEKMLKQLALDMENQLLQVKTQVAIAIADQHLLETKHAEHETAAASWKEKAALAVTKNRDDMARQALERSLSHAQLRTSFAQQLEDQRAEAESLRNAFLKLQQKLVETRAHCDLLIAEHRRARAIGKAHQAHQASRPQKRAATIERYKAETLTRKASNFAAGELNDEESLEERFATMARDEQVETLLLELKRQKSLSA